MLSASLTLTRPHHGAPADGHRPEVWPTLKRLPALCNHDQPRTKGVLHPRSNTSQVAVRPMKAPKGRVPDHVTGEEHGVCAGLTIPADDVWHPTLSMGDGSIGAETVDVRRLDRSARVVISRTDRYNTRPSDPREPWEGNHNFSNIEPPFSRFEALLRYPSPLILRL
jgi:hypothetical protein